VRQGWACAAMRQRAVTYAGTSTTLASATTPQRRGGGSPLGGRTGHNPARPGREAARPCWGGRGPTPGLARNAPDQNACGDGSSRDHTHHGCQACGLLLRLAEQQATRAGQVGARHNGGRVQRGHKQSFSGSLGTRYMRQPVMLSCAATYPAALPGWAGLDARTGLLFPPCAERAMLCLLGRWQQSLSFS
jgi:hypothetical protein